MSKRSKNFVIGLAMAGLIGYLIYSQAVRVDVGAPSVSKVGIEGQGIRINVKLPILNRSDLDYPIDGFLGQIFYGPAPIANVSLAKPMKIPARSWAEPEFTALINWASLATGVFDILKSTGAVDWLMTKAGIPTTSTSSAPMSWQNFSIKGTLYISSLSIDINQTLA